MTDTEKVYQISDNLLEQLDFKDEIQFRSTTREEREALHLLQNNRVIIIGSRYSKNFLYPGENFNNCISQGSRDFFSLKNENYNYSMLPGGFSKVEWGIIVVVLIIFIVIMVLLYFTILETNEDQFAY